MKFALGYDGSGNPQELDMVLARRRYGRPGQTRR